MDSLATEIRNTEAAEEALKKALEHFEACDNKQAACPWTSPVPASSSGTRKPAKKVVADFIQNNHDDKKIHLHAEDMFRKIGMHDKGKEIITNSSREVVALNNQAVRMAQAGDLRGSVELLMQAVAKFQGNTVIVLNARPCHSGLHADAWLGRGTGQICERYLTTVKNQDPITRKYLMLADLYKETAKHTGSQI